MTFPTYDPSVGLLLNEDSTDLAFIWPRDANEWTAAVVRAVVWQFLGQWKYDQGAGIDYFAKVLGVAPDRRVIQEAFRSALSPYVAGLKIKLRQDGSDLLLDWEGSAGESGTISLIEPPAVTEITLEASEYDEGTEIALRFTEQLNESRVPLPANFEVLDNAVTVTAVSVASNHVYLTLSGSATGVFSIVYTPDERPLQGVNRVLVTPFRVVFDLTEALVTEGGLELITEAGEGLITE